jgi:hypothetical protein
LIRIEDYNEDTHDPQAVHASWNNTSEQARFPNHFSIVANKFGQRMKGPLKSERRKNHGQNRSPSFEMPNIADLRWY